jgi:hypothetical protein
MKEKLLIAISGVLGVLLGGALGWWVLAPLLQSVFSTHTSSSKPEPQPKYISPQPETLKPNHPQSPSVACSADGKTVYWICSGRYNSIGNWYDTGMTMYKSEDGGKTWVEIYPYPFDPKQYLEFDFDPDEEKPTKAVPIPRNGK